MCVRQRPSCVRGAAMPCARCVCVSRATVRYACPSAQRARAVWAKRKGHPWAWRPQTITRGPSLPPGSDRLGKVKRVTGQLPEALYGQRSSSVEHSSRRRTPDDRASWLLCRSGVPGGSRCMRRRSSSMPSTGSALTGSLRQDGRRPCPLIPRPWQSPCAPVGRCASACSRSCETLRMASPQHRPDNGLASRTM